MNLQQTSGIGTLRGGTDGLAVRVSYRAVLRLDGNVMFECSGTLIPVVPGRLLPPVAPGAATSR